MPDTESAPSGAIVAGVKDGQSPAALVPSTARLGLLRPIAQPAEIIESQNATRALIHETLKEGRDYGLIPGIDKPSLFKPGAERVCLGFGCTPKFRVIEQEVDHDRLVPWRKVKAIWDGPRGNRKKTGEEIATGESLGLYRYVIECDIIHRESGQIVGSCIGSCSTMESKYIDRPRDSENTVIKMAGKRAFVGAALIAFGLSEQFTQDVEDLPREVVSRDVPPGDDDAVKCPKCQGMMWDNRITNDEREKAGKKRMPDYKCKKKECEAVIWDAGKYAEELAARDAGAPAPAPAASATANGVTEDDVADAPVAGARLGASWHAPSRRAPTFPYGPLKDVPLNAVYDDGAMRSPSKGGDPTDVGGLYVCNDARLGEAVDWAVSKLDLHTAAVEKQPKSDPKNLVSDAQLQALNTILRDCDFEIKARAAEGRKS